MAEYRAYLLNAQGRIASRFEYDSRDDEAALEHAQQYVDGYEVEVWQSNRVVAKLSHHQPGPPPQGNQYAARNESA